MKTAHITSILAIFLNIALLQAQIISSKKALEDVSEFRDMLQTQSSYLKLSKIDYEKELVEIEENFRNKKEIHIAELHTKLSKILYAIGDRHSDIELPENIVLPHKLAHLCLPFKVASYNNTLVALKRDDAQYAYFLTEFPYLTAVDGIPIADFLQQYALDNATAPRQAMLTRGAEDLYEWGKLMAKNNVEIKDNMAFTFSNKNSSITQILPLAAYNGRYKAVADIKEKFEDALDAENFSGLSKWIDKNIAYTAIPKMYNFKQTPSFKKHLENTMHQFKNAEHLIIDIRYNKGGARDIIHILAPYLVSKAESPWVANKAYVRSDQYLAEDIASMQYRYLLTYNSEKLNAEDRIAIDTFNSTFLPETAFNISKFSTPYYMVLHHGSTSFKGKVYILMNERSFSAASVMAAVFKGLSKVTLVGTTTDGSSGRSLKFKLTNSQIEMKLSTMLSFQRNGKTLDGNGTNPDLELNPDATQVLGKRDSQLQDLVTSIKKRNNN